MPNQKVARLEAARAAIETKDFSLYFYVPEVEEGFISGAIIEIYQLAAGLRTAGYQASILTDKASYQVPGYLDEDLAAVPHISIEGDQPAIKLEDIIVIPEYFIPAMQHTAKLPGIRVALVQGYDNALLAALPGTSWREFGIRHVWSMSQPLTDFITPLLGRDCSVQTLRIGIPDYFKPAPIKDPVIAVQVRNATDLKKISHEFYLRYPELRWVGFEPLHGLSRRRYADLLSRAAVCLWVDRVAAFGQTAVEAMACATPLVALVPDYEPEYLTPDNAVWVTKFAELARVLGQAFKLNMENGLPQGMAEAAAQTAALYNAESAQSMRVSALEATLAERVTELGDLIHHYAAQTEGSVSA